MQAGWALRLKDALRKMRVRVLLFSLGGIALAISARYIAPYCPKFRESTSPLVRSIPC